MYLDLDEPLIERPEPPQRWIRKRIFPSPQKLSLAQLKRFLDQIATFNKLEGVVIHLREIPKGNGKLQSLRQYLQDFQSKDKKVIIYAQDYSFLSYYLASVADRIYIQKGGALSIIGLEMTRIFLKDIFEKYDLKYDNIPIAPYKSAGDMFVRSDISAEDREQYQAIVDTVFDIALEEISESITKTKAELKDIVDNGPYTAREALEMGLVHEVINEEELNEVINELTPRKRKVKMIPFKKCKKMFPIKKTKKNLIAVISATGTIVKGKSQKPPITPPGPIQLTQVGDQTVVRKVRQAIADKRIKAVVLHVNSGGGSASASEAMRSATKELVKKKPLVVYFNDVAASGGYYIATGANLVVAQGMTLTGSIGVLGGKFVVDKSLEKRGIHKVYLRKGKHAGILSQEKPFTKKEREEIQKLIEYIYEVFVEHVSEFRDINKEELEPNCRGRVWSGKQALDIGLVDSLGNIQDAIKKAAKLANLKEGKYSVKDLYRDEPVPPLKVKSDGSIEFDIEAWFSPYKKEHIWMILPEKIEIS